MSCGHEHADGAYLLGALSPEDRTAFERHLEDCTDCTRAVGELAGLPGLLARVPIEQVSGTEVPTAMPDTLLPQLVRRVQARRRRRALVSAGLVAATAAAVVGLGVSVHSQNAPARATPAAGADPAPVAGVIAPAVAMRSVGQDPVSASLSLTSAGWGTRLELTCDERRDTDSGNAISSTSPSADSSNRAAYAMFVYTVDGGSEQVATWRSVPGGVVHVSGATATRRQDITEVVVRNAGGTPVLDLARRR